jgi:hypothetical protein
MNRQDAENAKLRKENLGQDEQDWQDEEKPASEISCAFAPHLLS